MHAAQTADTAARCGRLVADAARRWLEKDAWPTRRIPINVESPVCWVSPNALAGDASPPHGAFLLRVDRFVDGGTLVARQGERVLWSKRRRHLVPARHVAADADLRGVDPAGHPVTFGLNRPA